MFPREVALAPQDVGARTCHSAQGCVLLVEAGRRTGRGCQPIEGRVGEELVAIDGVLGHLGRIGPLSELLYDLGELADR